MKEMNGMEKVRECIGRVANSPDDFLFTAKFLRENLKTLLAALDADKPAEDVRDIARRVIGYGLTEASRDVSRKSGIQEAITKTGTLIEAYAAKKCAAERLRTLEEVQENIFDENKDYDDMMSYMGRLITDAKKAIES